MNTTRARTKSVQQVLVMQKMEMPPRFGAWSQMDSTLLGFAQVDLHINIGTQLGKFVRGAQVYL